MLTGFMSVSLFHVIFVTRYEIKSLSPQKKTNCPVRCYSVLVARTLFYSTRERGAVLYIASKCRNYKYATGE